MTALTQPVPQEPVLLREDADGIATLTMNRPDKYNALSNAMLDALQAEFDVLKDDRSVRVVILAARGKAFSAGHDLKEMRETPGREACKTLFDKCSRMMVSMTRIPQPVIAKVQGLATAAGCQMVAQADLAIAADTASFATSGINVGLFCSTPMVAVTRNLPRKQAMEMLMTGDFIDAETACAYGLINRAVPVEELDAAVLEMADKIAAKTPVSIAMGKKLFYYQIEHGLKSAYERAGEIMTNNMMTEDAQGAIDAFNAKKPMPEWKGK